MNVAFFWIGLGGALGAMARVGLMRVIPPFFLSLPTKIVVVNLLGCFLMGILSETLALYGNPSVNLRHFLFQGLLGGFTTFSAFALEYGELFEKGFHWTAISYVLLSVVGGIGLFFLGIKLIKGFA